MTRPDYRAEKKYLQILLSSTQAGPGRKVKQEQEEISRNHVPRLLLGSVCLWYLPGHEPELVPPAEGELGVVVPDGRAQVEDEDVVVEDLQRGVPHPHEWVVVVAPTQDQARKPGGNIEVGSMR